VSSTLGPGPETTAIIEEGALLSDTGPVDESHAAGPWRELWRRFRKDRVAMTGLAFVVLVILVAVVAPLVAPFDPTKQSGEISAAPSSAHLLGTDDVGRDILSRLIYGARVSMYSSFGIVLIALLLAIPLGLLAGYFRGGTDSVISRVMDALFTFPPLLLAISVASLLGSSLRFVVLAIAIVFVPGFVRLIRAQVLTVREETYIEASRSVGAGNGRIILRHVLPNVASPLIVQAALSFGYALLAEAGLSFLGLGVSDPTSSWGYMLNRAYPYVLDSPWPLVPPGIAIFLTVLAFNLVGDGLRDALGRERFRLDEAATTIGR
jgi:ABC-type dipeptide/oligopeptide/nickel transport system permease subunit